jgi:hypothetical protein
MARRTPVRLITWSLVCATVVWLGACHEGNQAQTPIEPPLQADSEGNLGYAEIVGTVASSAGTPKPNRSLDFLCGTTRQIVGVETGSLTGLDGSYDAPLDVPADVDPPPIGTGVTCHVTISNGSGVVELRKDVIVQLGRTRLARKRDQIDFIY